MKAKEQKHAHNYLLLLTFFVCILMIVACIAMLFRFSGTIEDEAGNIALQYVDSAANNLKVGLEVYESKAHDFGVSILGGSYDDEEDFSIQMHRMSKESRYGDIYFIRYFKNGAEYNVADNEFNITMELSEITEFVEKGELACIGIVPDKQFNLSVISYFVPLENFEYADSLLVFYPVSSVASYSASLNNVGYDNSRLAVYTTPQGQVVKILHADEDIDIREYGDVYSLLRDDLNKKVSIDDLRVTIESGKSEKFFEDVGGESCTVAVSSAVEHDTTILSVVGYYRCADIYPSGYYILQAILGALLVFFLAVLIVSIVTIIQKLYHKRMLNTINDTNRQLGCDSRFKFERIAAERIEQNKATSFAIVVIDVNHYEYIVEQFGSEVTLKILKHLQMLYSRMLQLNETLGYCDNGRFVLLLHYRELDTLEARISSLEALAAAHSAQLTESAMLVLLGGIYTTDKNLTHSVSKMIDLAIEAEKASKYQYDFGKFRYYNETIHSSAVQNDYIELHMESALKNHDFKVFYQAKYNINERRPDGCEALVRWYNPDLDEYMQPDVFLPLFEANQFIIKLDHYVFEQVCLYIEDAVMNGLPLFPVSVNASRITATADDFVSFYVNTKQKHDIADGFITIEFTESFAYEDYDMLRETVKELHEAGFKCSIDDFGSGFSSYNILKELPMDEIKLDRFFIRRGFSSERDLKVLSSVISLGRELHMKVTQEGVENKDQLELLKSLGCQVIQGYFYSKPLSLTDYTGFLSSAKIL